MGVASPGPSGPLVEGPLVEGMWDRMVVYLRHAHGDTRGVGLGMAGLAAGMVLWPKGRGREKGGEQGKGNQPKEQGAGEERARWAVWTLVGAWGSYVLLWHAVLVSTLTNCCLTVLPNVAVPSLPRSSLMVPVPFLPWPCAVSSRVSVEPAALPAIGLCCARALLSAA